MGGLRPIIGVDVGWLVGWGKQGKQEQQLENGSSPDYPDYDHH